MQGKRAKCRAKPPDLRPVVRADAKGALRRRLVPLRAWELSTKPVLESWTAAARVLLAKERAMLDALHEELEQQCASGLEAAA